MANPESKPHTTHGSVLDDLGFSPPEALELKVKAEIYTELLQHIQERGLAQQQLAGLLGMHQPDVSHLLNGKISKFSVSKLLRLAGRLNLSAQVKLTRLKPDTSSRMPVEANQRKRMPAAVTVVS
jgi:predicted XRE-type DNA-binding protein